MKDAIILDIETSGRPHDGTLLVLGVVDTSIGDPWVYRGDEVPDGIWGKLGDPEVPIVTASDYDAWWERLAGHTINGPFYDIQTMWWLLDENTPLDLDWLTQRHLGYDPDKRIKQRNNEPVFMLRTEDDKEVAIPLKAFADRAISNYYHDRHEAWRQLLDYNKRDIVATYKLFKKALHKIDKFEWTEHWQSLEVPYTEVLLDMQCRGMPLNEDDRLKLREQLDKERIEAERKVFDLVGYEFNLNSGDQLAEVLFSNLWYSVDRVPVADPETFKKATYNQWVEMGGDGRPFADWKVDVAKALVPNDFSVGKVGRAYIHGAYLRKGCGLEPTPLSKKKKRPKTDARSLMVQHPTHEVVKAVLDHSKIDKIIGTYLDAYPRFMHEGRLYGRFKRHGTVTGRISAYSPNLMNQPSRGRLGTLIRSLFQGNFIIGDHGQLEPRLMAHFSGDPFLMDIYENDKDLYCEMGERVFGKKVSKGDDERQIAKTFILALGYDAQAPTLATTLCLYGFPTTEAEAAGYLSELEEVLRPFFDWKKAVVRFARDHGYVKTIGGRVRRLRTSDDDAAYWKLDQRGERQAVNSIIQGSASDILQRNMLHTNGMPGLRLLCQVHDELVWEYGDLPLGHDLTLQRLQVECEDPGFDIRVPLKFEPVFANSWAEKEGPVADLDTLLAA